MRILPCGERAVLVELDDLGQVLGLHAALTSTGERLPGVVELVPAARTLLVAYDPAVTTADRLAASLGDIPLASAAQLHGPRVELAVTYDGEDLAEVAQLTGLSQGEVVARHRGCDYVVAFCGFAPGFGYLAGGDPDLRVPRRDSPRTQVPVGAVALADDFTGVYPRSMPGGWQLIGRTDALLWMVERDPPALLAPGTRVRFVAAEQ